MRTWRSLVFIRRNITTRVPRESQRGKLCRVRNRRPDMAWLQAGNILPSGLLRPSKIVIRLHGCCEQSWTQKKVNSRPR